MIVRTCIVFHLFDTSQPPTNLVNIFTLHIQEVKEFYQEKGAEEGPDTIVIISGSEIAIDVQDDGIALPSGWSLSPLTNPKVSVL